MTNEKPLSPEEITRITQAWGKPAPLAPGMVVLDASDREHLRAAVAAVGAKRVAELSSASRVTVVNAAAGAAIRKGTAVMLRLFLKLVEMRQTEQER